MTLKDKIERIMKLRDSLRIKLMGMGLVGQFADFQECVSALADVEVHGYTYTPITDLNTFTIQPGYYPEGSLVKVVDHDLIGENIKPGVSILGVEGAMPRATLADPEITIDSSSGVMTVVSRVAEEGYANDTTFNTVIQFLSFADSDLKPENIKKDVTIFGVTGTLQQGSGSFDPPDPDGEVRFYDYDGSLLYSYALVDIQSQSELPPLPKHYGLTCQGWNWTLDEIKTLSYGVNVGAMYITDDEATKLHIEIPNTAMLTVPLAFNQNLSEGVTVDWGDGSATETASGTGNQLLFHTYPREGNFTISLLPATSCTLRLGHNLGAYSVLGEVNDNTKCILNMLKGVNFGRRVTAVGSYTFQYCRGLEYVTFVNTITSMGNYSFNYASSLKCAILPNKVTSVSTFTFGSCFALRTLSLPLKVSTLGASAFRYCYCLESVTIPPNVTTLSGYVFSENYCLKRANVPPTVTSFGNFVFYKCFALSEFDYPDSLTTLGSNAFYQNYSLSSVKLSDATTSIGTYAFYDCHAITELDIPAGVTEIKAYAFQNCYGLKRVWVRATTPPALDSTAFTGIPDDCVIYIPAGWLWAYKEKSGWKDYLDHIQETDYFPAI